MDSNIETLDLECDLSNCTKEELIEKIRKLRLQVKQLRNVIQKSCERSASIEPSSKKPKKDARLFDFSRHPKRHVALRILYLGWDYAGLAAQEDSVQTIEAHLFNALMKTKLIASRETSNYHRCGRTDKGVSAFGQVVSLYLRCKATNGLGVIPPVLCHEVSGDDYPEINYPQLLNQVLPSEIRVLAWVPVPHDFSARHSTVSRTYKYYFPPGNLNLLKMEQAASLLIGVHDFRNFCKLEKSGKKETIRAIVSVQLEHSPCLDKGDSMVALRIVGRSFLWHQIRNIVAILFLIGQELEEPNLISQLLDIQTQPKKPQYSMGADYPLVLFDSIHPNITWKLDSDSTNRLLKDLHSHWLHHRIRSWLIQDMMETLGCANPAALPQGINRLIMGTKTKVHLPILDRPRCHRLTDGQNPS